MDDQPLLDKQSDLEQNLEPKIQENISNQHLREHNQLTHEHTQEHEQSHIREHSHGDQIKGIYPVAYGAILAIISAISFGITTPWISRTGQNLQQFETASMLYIGAAIVSIGASLTTKQQGKNLSVKSIPWLILVGVVGGGLAPTLFTWGLVRTSATSSSLVLNLEAVFTVIFSKVFFNEYIGKQVWIAVLLMTIGGMLISLDAVQDTRGSALGLGAVILATAVWALDNIFTRPLELEKPLDVVAAKSILGALTTGLLAILFREPLPNKLEIINILLCGAFGYGFSLYFYLLAQRQIGAARTGSIFAIGPFFGAGLSWVLGDRNLGLVLGLSGVLAFAIGVYLHITEHHNHWHIHEEEEHEHTHKHDDGHHLHDHDQNDPPLVNGWHTHKHKHQRMEHKHEHAPAGDIHHEHH